MMLSPDLMRSILLFGMLSMVIVAAFYLRQRKMSWLAYAIWGLFAILFPVIGPFIVVWVRPGTQRIKSSIT